MKWLEKNKHWVIGGVALLTLITIIYISRRAKGVKGVISKLFKSKKMLVCSHITAIDSSQGTKAENTLKNIELLIANDIPIIEVDVQITKDGVPVLFHDNDLSPKTNGSGSISKTNWSDVSKLRYKADNSQGIAKLEDAIKILKKSGKPIIFQLDKCDANEIAKINSLGLFKGVEEQMLSKSTSFNPPQSVVQSGILYMPILPGSYVGKMNNDAVINEIVNKCKGKFFLEAQFGENDTLLLNGTLAKKLNEVGCKLFIVAVPGAPTTNAPSFRGDNQKQWAKMINPMGAGAIMTNRPLALKKYIDTL